ncbi:MAG: DUF4145 domain-containing protein [Opitutae bacterium]|nr:DUF4145 domain-containing protein [Opitutae bacterium]
MRVPVHRNDFGSSLDDAAWSKWSTNALNLLEIVFGPKNTAFQSLDRIAKAHRGESESKDKGLGIFKAAKEDFEHGFSGQLEKQISGEIFGSFVTLAKTALAEGQKDVAAVLACAALEDALKRYAALNGLTVDGKTMDNVVGALKAAGLVQGAQKSLLDAMPRVRNCAMHADWAKITEPDVNSVIGFVESFLQTKF